MFHLEPITKSERFQRIYNLLSRKPGFSVADWRPLTGEMIEFNIAGVGQFFIRIEDSEQTYFELIFPYFAKRSPYETSELYLRATNIANVQSKMAKLYFWEDSMYCCVQVQAASERDFVGEIDRYISASQFGVQNFRQILLQERQRAPAF